jgi:GDP-mannose 4,6 dehydratase
VTRKITRAVAAIEYGHQAKLYLGNLDAQRDWGHARDYVEGMWLILQQSKPDDYVLATGEAHSVREFVEKAFAYTGRKIEWQGKGESERGVEAGTGRILVEVDPRYFRPTEVDYLVGDPSKARRQLGWQHRVSFDELVEQMVKEDLKLAKQRATKEHANFVSIILTCLAGATKDRNNSQRCQMPFGYVVSQPQAFVQSRFLMKPITARRMTAPMTALRISAAMPPTSTNPILGNSQPAMKAPTMPTTILPMSPKP